MSLTRIDTDFYISAREEGFVHGTAVNAGSIPGSMLFCGTVAAKNSIGSQVACKLALEHFVDGGIECAAELRKGEYLESESGEIQSVRASESAQRILEAAFKKANNSVYSFGHKLAAGGRMAASLLGASVQHGVFAAGRVGNWGVYLLRKGVLYSLFEDEEVQEDHKTDYVGAHSMVTVETASVPLEAGDYMLAFSSRLSEGKRKELLELMSTIDFDSLEIGIDNPAVRICQGLFDEDEEPDLCMYAGVGSEAVFLNEVYEGNGF